MAPSQAGKQVVQRSAGRYDSLILDAFTTAFGCQSAGGGA
jgi:hypothetical protein